jgi:hypothetical protein
MATTYGDTAYPARNNSALYWGIAIAVVLAAVIYFATRDRSANMQATPNTMAPSTTTEQGTTGIGNSGTTTNTMDTGSGSTTGTQMGTTPPSGNPGTSNDTATNTKNSRGSNTPVDSDTRGTTH